ncbi:MAG: DUF6600 domain-containing protein, partial [Pyrinomonadaceae bacterium]
MRSKKTLLHGFLFLLATILTIALPIRSLAQNSQTEVYEDINARVVRISLIRGEVSLKRNGGQKWESAQINFPLVEGDAIATDRDARAEIQIDARNFVRLDGDSVLRVVTLRDEGVALSLSEGTASVRLARFDHDHEYFEVDAPKTTLAAEKKGLYRLDVTRDGNVRLSVRSGGQARIYSDTSGFTLRDGRSAEIVYNGTDEGDWQFSSLSGFDSWDRWNDERERYLAARLKFEQRDRYYDDYIWGAEELDSYGSWSYANDYGWIWRPSVTVINNYGNWAPYRYGHWTWCPPYGWTWVGDEPWGWAPYHYGRWVYYDNSWCWAPRHYYNQHHYWSPALVAFIILGGGYGDSVAWYPLNYHQPDPRRYYSRKVERLTPLRSNEIANLQRTNPAYLRAVTTQPAREFGGQVARLQPASDDLARRAVTTEPLRGRLPIRPADSGGANALRDTRTLVARPVQTVRAPSLPERPTGAAARAPGIPLDETLRRERVFNGREPARPVANVEGQTNRSDGSEPVQRTERPLGAVTRPARPVVRTPVERSNDREGDGSTDSPVARPSLPSRSERPARPRDERPPAVTDESPNERKGRPERVERPERNERVAPPVERPAQPVERE